LLDRLPDFLPTALILIWPQRPARPVSIRSVRRLCIVVAVRSATA
jgi:hypothetical protein